MKIPAALVGSLCASFALAVTATASPALHPPPAFPELVARADLIIRAKVTAVSSRDVKLIDQYWLTTRVTFAVLKTLKGEPCSVLNLEFPGGRYDGVEATVVTVGLLEFEVGAEEFLFVSPAAGICPLVGAKHGRLRVLTTSDGASYLARDNLTPLMRVADIAQPMEGVVWKPLRAEVTLSPEAFEASIRAEVVQPSPPTPRAPSDFFFALRPPPSSSPPLASTADTSSPRTNP